MPSDHSAPRTVILWVHPRSTSTMFECCMLNRPEFEVLHEPMGDAYYFGPEKVAPRYSDEVCAKDYSHYANATFEETWKNIVKPREDGKRVFSKDMAQYIFSPPSSNVTSVPSLGKPGNPTLIPTVLLLDPSIQHSFLIRTPEKAVPSYHRLCYPGSETGFDYWDPEEAGYKELRELYDFLKSQERDPVILESEDLLKEPVKVMRYWCESAGIEFEESMLEWTEGTREHFAKWPGFHKAAENSSGIGKNLKEEDKTPCNYEAKPEKSPESSNTARDHKKQELPEEVKKCIKANMADYQYLSSCVKKVY